MSQVDWKGYRVLGWAGLLVLLSLIVIVVFAKPLNGEFATSVLIATVGAWLLLNSGVPSFFGLIYVIGAVIAAAGWFWNLYDHFGLYDKLAHVFATWALTLVGGFWGCYSRFEKLNQNRSILAVALITFGLTLGILWEFAEYYLFTRPDNMTLADTMNDLVMDSVGAILAVPTSFWALSRYPSGKPTVVP